MSAPMLGVTVGVPCATKAAVGGSASADRLHNTAPSWPFFPIHVSPWLMAMRGSDNGVQDHDDWPLTITSSPSHCTVQPRRDARSATSSRHASPPSTFHRPPSDHRVPHADKGTPALRSCSSASLAKRGASPSRLDHHAAGVFAPVGDNNEGTTSSFEALPQGLWGSVHVIQPCERKAQPHRVFVKNAPSSASFQCAAMVAGASSQASKDADVPHKCPPRQRRSDQPCGNAGHGDSECQTSSPSQFLNVRNHGLEGNSPPRHLALASAGDCISQVVHTSEAQSMGLAASGEATGSVTWTYAAAMATATAITGKAQERMG